MSADVDGPGPTPDGDAMQQDHATQPREGDGDVTLESVAKHLEALDGRLASLERYASVDTAGLQGGHPPRTNVGTPIRAAWDDARVRTVAAWNALRGDATGPTHRDPRTGEQNAVTHHPSNANTVDPPDATPPGDGDSSTSTAPSPPPRGAGRTVRTMVMVVLALVAILLVMEIGEELTNARTPNPGMHTAATSGHGVAIPRAFA